jgi:hypothetical protein
MNFTRITQSTVNECFNLDMQFSRMRNIIGSDIDVSKTEPNFIKADQYQETATGKVQCHCEVLPPTMCELSVVPALGA